MSGTYRIDWHDGWLCVVYTDSEWSNPVRYAHWWPAERGPREDYAELIGKPTSVHNGEFSARRWENGPWFSSRLLNGGQTQPIRTDRTPVLCPKVRAGIETRYRDGQWQKHLKTAGWVPA
ncbi:MAG TPA: hypothetical protein VNU68_07240 [Verrucomicrobiae bacterium]|nr:hypothetical protein [Verrucomicrobiae bacterium]